MARPKRYDDAFAADLVEAAGALLAERGAAGVTVRDVADAAGASTSAVYTLFGGKADLIAAVVREGFQRFATALGSSSLTDDPLQDLAELGLAYRRFAIGSSNFYRVMFHHPVPDDYAPTAQDAAVQEATFTVLVGAVERCQGAQAIRSDRTAEHLALQIWALVHGLAGLELRGSVDPTAAESHWSEATRALIAGMRP